VSAQAHRHSSIDEPRWSKRTHWLFGAAQDEIHTLLLCYSTGESVLLDMLPPEVIWLIMEQIASLTPLTRTMPTARVRVLAQLIIVYVLTLEGGSNADAMRMELIESGAVEWVVSLQSHRSFMLVCHLASDAKCTQFLGTRPIVKFMVRWISTATLEQVRSDGARALLAIESASAEGQQLVHEHARRCSLAAHLNIGIDPSIPVSKDIKELLARLARGPQS